MRDTPPHKWAFIPRSFRHGGVRKFVTPVIDGFAHLGKIRPGKRPAADTVRLPGKDFFLRGDILIDLRLTERFRIMSHDDDLMTFFVI